MRTLPTIARNVSSLVITEIISRIVQFLVFVYIARMLGDVKIGVLGFATSLTNLFAVIPRFGFDYLTIRDVSREPHKGQLYFTNIVVLKAILSLITFAIVVILSLTISSITEYRLVLYIVTATMIFISYSDFTFSLYRALQIIQWEATIRSITIIIAGLAGALIVYLGINLTGYVGTTMIAYILGLIGALFFLFMKFYDFQWQFDQSFCKTMLKNSIPFILLSIFTAINQQIGTVMISFMKNFQITGWFNAAYKFLFTFTFIPTSFVAAILPALSQSYNKKMDNFFQVYSHSLRWLFIIACPFTILMAIRSTDIIMLVYGKTFINSAPALTILIFSLAFIFLNPVVGNVLISADLQKYAVRAAVIAALVNIMLNGVLIVFLGHIGASIAYLVANIVNFCVQKIYADKYVIELKIISVLKRPLLASGIFALVIYLTKSLPIIMVLFMAVIIYVALIIITNSISKEDRDIIKNAASMFHR